jgi:hypothetical protein
VGRIHIDTFCSLDLVGQAPGGPDEGPDDGFAHGGWQWPMADDPLAEQIAIGMEGTDALVVGRRTFSSNGRDRRCSDPTSRAS